MKKRMLAVLALPVLVSFNPAFAAELTTKIESFYYLNNAGRVAEICGHVTGIEKGETAAVRILVDPNSSHPGAYSTLADSSGAFCTLVATYTGAASSSASVAGKTSLAVTANVSTERE